MKWRDVVQDYQQKQWDLMNIPSMYALEVFVASIELNVDILQWLPDPEGKMKIRVKFHTLPCVELKGTYEENPQSVHKESMANIEKINAAQAAQGTAAQGTAAQGTAAQGTAAQGTPVKKISGEKSEVKGFNPLLCLVKEKLEPPVPKVHKLPGEDDSESDLKKEEKAEDEKSLKHERMSITSQTSEKSAKNTKKRKSGTMDTKATNKSLAEEVPVKSIAFNDGKSVIFTSTPTELIHSLMTIPLAVNIFVNGPMVIGHTLLALHQFSEVVTISIDSTKNIPCSAVLDGKFDIFNRGKYVGMVDLDLRLICLGQKMVHMITSSDNQNEDVEVESKGTMSTPSMRVLKINVREKPFTSRMEKLLENEGTSEYFYPPSFKEATIAPPMLLSDDFFTMIDEMNAIGKRNAKPKRELLKYKCTDMDTIVQRKVLEELIATQKPPFHKGSPFRKLVCPVYLKNKNIDWNERKDKIYCCCDVPTSTSTSGYKICKPQVNKGKTENDPNLFYDPYLQCETIDYTNPSHLAYCCMKGSRIRPNAEIDPEEALKTVANINKKVEHYKKVLNDLVFDSDVNVYHCDPVENTTSKVSGNDQNWGNIQTPFDEVTEQIIPQIIQKLPQLIASQGSQPIPRVEKYDSIYQNEQWRCLKPVCRCQKY